MTKSPSDRLNASMGQCQCQFNTIKIIVRLSDDGGPMKKKFPTAGDQCGSESHWKISGISGLYSKVQPGEGRRMQSYRCCAESDSELFVVSGVQIQVSPKIQISSSSSMYVCRESIKQWFNIQCDIDIWRPITAIRLQFSATSPLSNKFDTPFLI